MRACEGEVYSNIPPGCFRRNIPHLEWINLDINSELSCLELTARFVNGTECQKFYIIGGFLLKGPGKRER